MANATSNVTIRLGVQDDASAKIQNVKQGLAGLSSAGGGLAQVAVDATSLSGALTMMGATAPQVLAVTKALELLGGAVDMARVSANVQMVEASFNRLSGTIDVSGASMLASLRAVSSGMIADSDLMLAANKALVLGVAENANEMAHLLQVAIARGAEVGLAPTQAFSDLVSGLGRGQAEILDNLGIVLDANAAYKQYAASINTTVEALTKEQRTRALVNAVMAATPDALRQAAAAGDSAAAAFARWDAATKNFSETFGRVFLPMIADGIDLVTRFINAAGGVAGALSGKLNVTPEKLDEDIASYKAAIADLQNTDKYKPSAQVDSQIAYYRDQIAMAEQAKAMLVGSADAAAGAVARVGQAATETGNALGGSSVLIAEVADRLRQLSTQGDATGAALTSMYIAAAADLGVDQALAGLQAKRTELDLLRQEWQHMYTTEEEFQAAEAVFLARTNQELAGQRAAVDSVAAAAANAAGMINSLRNSVTTFKANALASIESSLGGIAVGLMDNMDPDAALAWLDQQSAAYATQIDQLSAMRNADGSLKYTNQEILLLLQGQVAETGKWATGLDKVASSTSSVKSEFDALKSQISDLVSGELSDALQLDVTWPGSDGGGGDAINENARRLAAIANEGLIGQDWLGEFATEVPDIFAALTAAADPAAAAQQMLTEFQQGLRPELLDFEMLKQRVKDELTSQQAIAAMTGDITSQLMAEMGVSAAQVQAAMGGLGLSSASSDTDQFGAGFEEGIDAQATASGSLAKIAKAFLENEANVRASGGVVGAWWGEGFMAVVGNNVPPGLLDLLTNLLLPRIQAAAAAQASQTGAP